MIHVRGPRFFDIDNLLTVTVMAMTGKEVRHNHLEYNLGTPQIILKSQYIR